MRRGFSIIELLIVIIVMAILAGLAVETFSRYHKLAIRTSLLHDIRMCIDDIAAARSTQDNINLQEIVANCQKSPYTQSIELISENPIKLKATASNTDFSCEYNEETGRITCEDVFQ